MSRTIKTNDEIEKYEKNPTLERLNTSEKSLCDLCFLDGTFTVSVCNKLL